MSCAIAVAVLSLPQNTNHLCNLLCTTTIKYLVSLPVSNGTVLNIECVYRERRRRRKRKRNNEKKSNTKCVLEESFGHIKCGSMAVRRFQSHAEEKVQLLLRYQLKYKFGQINKDDAIELYFHSFIRNYNFLWFVKYKDKPVRALIVLCSSILWEKWCICKCKYSWCSGTVQTIKTLK